jgi:hypothetical protein
VNGLERDRAERMPRRTIRQRLVPATITFFVVAGAVYLTALVSLDLIRHIVMPVVAILVGGYVARAVYRSRR